MKEQKSRRDQYAGDLTASTAAASSSMTHQGPSGISDSPLYQHTSHLEQRRRNQHNLQHPSLASASSSTSNVPVAPLIPLDEIKGDTILDLGGLQQTQQQQQMQYAQANNVATMEYMESRSQAIESIESTIAELGQIYQNFATLLSTQREMVQRIDDNILDMQMNVEGAHGQLAKYYQSISSNRGLMLKIFAVLIVFFMLFVLMT